MCVCVCVLGGGGIICPKMTSAFLLERKSDSLFKSLELLVGSFFCSLACLLVLTLALPYLNKYKVWGSLSPHSSRVAREHDLSYQVTQQPCFS